jgi:hypothetical protein
MREATASLPSHQLRDPSMPMPKIRRASSTKRHTEASLKPERKGRPRRGRETRGLGSRGDESSACEGVRGG